MVLNIYLIYQYSYINFKHNKILSIWIEEHLRFVFCWPTSTIFVFFNVFLWCTTNRLRNLTERSSWGKLSPLTQTAKSFLVSFLCSWLWITLRVLLATSQGLSTYFGRLEIFWNGVWLSLPTIQPRVSCFGGFCISGNGKWKASVVPLKKFKYLTFNYLVSFW